MAGSAVHVRGPGVSEEYAHARAHFAKGVLNVGVLSSVVAAATVYSSMAGSLQMVLTAAKARRPRLWKIR